MKSISMSVVAALALTCATSAGAFEITSPDVPTGSKIADAYVFSGFGCTGKNVSPSLKWSGAPENAKSFALMVYDPDAPTGSGFWHWVMFDIPVGTTELPQKAGDPSAGKAPAGAIQSRTDFGVPGYGGPCPPPGDAPHHYHFMLFATDMAKLDLNANTSAAVVGFTLHFHTLAKAEFIAVYGR